MADSTRTFPLEDIRIDPGGDGRTVTAYAAVFDTPTQRSEEHTSELQSQR